MKGQGNGQPVQYRIDLSGLVGQQIKDLGMQAAQAGCQDEFAAALKKIVHRLETDPLGFGELIGTLPNMKLIRHVGSIYPVTVQFYVNEEKRVVFIQRVILSLP